MRKRDPLKLALAPAIFKEHLAWLRKVAVVLPLSDFAAKLSLGTLPNNAVAITFDDGYLDNFEVAAPLLREFEIPATIFVATDPIGRSDEPWWEELDRVFLETARLSPRFSWRTFRVDVEASLPEGRAEWSVMDRPVTLREQAFTRASGFAKRLPAGDRDVFMGELRSWAGAGESCRSERRMATWEMVGAAHRDGLAIGGHTSSHAALATLDRAAQFTEVKNGRDLLAKAIGYEPETFAYPFGTYVDFTHATCRVVKQSGFKIGVANMTGHLRPRSDPFQLPRVLVQDWSVAKLAERLGL